MSRPLTVAAIALAALALGGSSAVAAPSPGVPTEPRRPVEHLAISGGMFQDRSGEPGCFGAKAGSKHTMLPIPRGSAVVGATVYGHDGTANGNLSVTLNRHSVISGGMYQLARAYTTGTPGSTSLELVVSPGYVLTTGDAPNLIVDIGPGVCFQGAEVHYIRDAALPPANQASRLVDSGVRADGSVKD